MIGLDDDITSATQIRRSQTYDAFGSVISETDGNGNTVDFEYNAMGQLTIKRDAATDITLENGFVVKGQRTETRYSYDVTGKLIGTLDAGGNLNTQSWYMGGGRAQIATEWHADGGVKKNAYDVFGNLRSTVNEDNWKTDYRYDANNRLIAMDRPISAGVKATDSYELDVKGQRISFTNALGFRSSTRYDSLGRVVETINPEGRRTAYSYTYDNTIASIGVGAGSIQTGGWRRVTTDVNGTSMTDDLDITGRVMRHVDLGGRIFTYRYNYSGLISNQTSTNGQNIDYSYYGNGYLRQVIDRVVGTNATYEYDNNGNRIFEGYIADDGQFAFQQQTVTYDAKNRVVSIRDPRYDITYEYDALGNRRYMRSVYTNGLGGQLAEQNYWYKYDSMSRFTISMGQLSGLRATTANGTTTKIVRGAEGDGVAFTYTQASLRASANYAPNSTTSEHTENYYYDGRGLLAQTRLSDGSVVVRDTDLAGRVTDVRVTDGTGKQLQNTTRTWSKDNQLLQEHDNLLNKGTRYELMADGTVTASQTYSSDSNDTITRTTFSYEWWDSAKQSRVTVQAKNAQVDSWNKVWQPGFSQFTYDANGHSKTAYDEAGKRAFSYWTDTDGQVLKRQEMIGGSYDPGSGSVTGATKAREHSYYYLDGHRIGDVGNDQTERADYAQALSSLRSNDGRRSYEKFTPSNAADFDANYQPINSEYPGAAPSAYTVRDGDTLESIARVLWGDATLWYLLAEANGLIGTQPSATLTTNSTLMVPNQVTNIHNTSATFKPYNPGKALGDTMPTLPAAPPPPAPSQASSGSNACGIIKAIIIVIIIMVVAYYTGQYWLAEYGAEYGAAAVAGGAAGGAAAGGAVTYTAGSYVIAGAIGGAAGSIAGQAAGNVLGTQSGFDWKAVGVSAVGGAISGGLAGGGMGVSTGNATFNMAANAAIGNALTQGASMALGVQDKFDWRGVAASAAGAGVGGYAQSNGYDSFSQGIGRGIGGYAVTGGSFRQALPGMVGNAVGEELTSGFDNAPPKSQMEQELEQRQNDSNIGQGMTLSAKQAAQWGPKFAMENDYAFERQSYDLIGSGQTPKLSLQMGANSGITDFPSSVDRNFEITDQDWADRRKAIGGYDISEAQPIALLADAGKYSNGILTTESIRDVQGNLSPLAGIRNFRGADSLSRKVGEGLVSGVESTVSDIKAAGDDPGQGLIGAAKKGGALINDASNSAPGTRLIKMASGALSDLFAGGSGELVPQILDGKMPALSYENAAQRGGAALLDIGLLGTGLMATGRSIAFADRLGLEANRTVTAYRVEGIPNQRIAINEMGEISLVPNKDQVMWVNFGQDGRATQYLQTKIDKGLPGAQLKSFEVDAGFVESVRSRAVPEKFARQNPNSPIISRDPYPDQYGIPKNDFGNFIKSIKQGSGKNGR